MVFLSTPGILVVSLNLECVGTQRFFGKTVQTHVPAPGIKPVTLPTGGVNSPTELQMKISVSQWYFEKNNNFLRYLEVMEEPS